MPQELAEPFPGPGSVVHGQFTVTVYAETLQADVCREYKVAFTCPRCGEKLYVRELAATSLPSLGFNEYIGLAEDVFGKVKNHACPVLRIGGTPGSAA